MHAARGATAGLDPGPRKVLNPRRPPVRSRVMDPLARRSPQTLPRAAPGRAQAIRRRLMDRVADADASHLTIDGDEGAWRPFLEGVTIKVLHEHDGALSYLLRLEPRATLPPHRHPRDEECVVLEGRLRVGTQLEIGPGGYHLAHGGALHATITAVTGATLFLRGAVPESSQVLE